MGIHGTFPKQHATIHIIRTPQKVPLTLGDIPVGIRRLQVFLDLGLQGLGLGFRFLGLGLTLMQWVAEFSHCCRFFSCRQCLNPKP